MKKLLTAFVLMALTGLLYAETESTTTSQGVTDYDAFYGIEDYNDPMYGDAYEKRRDEQAVEIRGLR